ncbi:ribonuclease T2 [Calycina marina]|uniref:ribonuclease T2 n=1 Tax=Calycina marina TaxID=1763456 RepID=A0A9P8CFN4_9HELO|nr:ribonuclease T2 [Calycina marina]
MMRSSPTNSLLFVAGVSAALYGESNLNHTCAIDDSSSILSCSPKANATLYDSCCVETYGGLFLSTQFWSTYTGLESSGQKLPADKWTLHGLWPDFCDGTYTQYCDLDRQYDPAPVPNTTDGKANGTVVPPWEGPGNITSFVTALGRLDLLAWMNKYWINQGAPNDDFWGHEFSKHATCFSTFDVPCYGPSYVQHSEIVEFYETAIMYYKRLPTWEWLSTADIHPSNDTSVSYSLSDFQTALVDGYGALPYVGCTGPKYNTTEAGKGSLDTGLTVLSEVWYNFHAFGKPQRGKWLPVNATYTTNCAKAKGAIKYYERTVTSVQ